MDKEELQKLLKQFSQEEIREALGQKPKNKKRRRGKGKRKKNSPAATNKSAPVNKFDDMMQSISLTADERKELADAEASDKMAKPNPNRGKRNAVKKQKFRCASCGKDFEMFPSQVYNRERWKCNRCVTGGR
tara:strand:+ start:4462 stop:4857 length:396 start_codon:yes stop_codon:yes gene_type:complete